MLQDINLTIRQGQTVAFVGMSGGGKSSLIGLIPRFYDVQQGAVKINGHDVRDLTLDSLRGSVGMVLQDNFLFSGTVRENILFGNPEADEENRRAKAANAHDFMPQGYETEVGERGVKLSGGQKQRLAIARVFQDPDILVLDEATSALDLESEHLIQQARNPCQQPHHIDRGPSPVNDYARRSNRCAGEWQNYRAGKARRADESGWKLCQTV